jgi:hypothetical protein
LLVLLSRSGVHQKVDHNLFRGLTKTHSQLSAQLALTHLSAEPCQSMPPCPPGPTFFRLSSSCQFMLTKITTFRGNCLQLALKLSHSGFPTLSNCSSFLLCHWQLVHISLCPSQTKSLFGLTCYWVSTKSLSTQATVPPKPVQAC